MSDLNKLIDFIKLTHEVRNVKRVLLLDDYDTYENDAEHSYQLAITAWFLIDTHKLKLDVKKCTAMALVHDIAEIHAGDTNVFADKTALESKAHREAEAIKKLKLDWPNFASMHELIEEYEALKTPEANFVYSLDKLIPVINNYIYGGKTWKNQGVTLERLVSVKKGKVDKHDLISGYNRELMKILKLHPEIFGRDA